MRENSFVSEMVNPPEVRGVMWVVVLAFVVFLILLFGPMVW